MALSGYTVKAVKALKSWLFLVNGVGFVHLAVGEE